MTKGMILAGVAFVATVPGVVQAQTGTQAPAGPVASDQATPPAATPTGAATPKDGADLGSNDGRLANGAGDTGREVLVTGSRIRQDPNNSALPLQIITINDLSRESINSPEQLISYLSTNGNGADNLAANSDVTSGAQRGTNGLSAANLRGQGAASTLVLLNGRRVAAHGLTGGAVDVNQIPFAALDRIEVLKDGASAIYGTDAVGGVINFITKKDFKGLTLNGFTDITQEGDAPIYRLSATAGYGDLATQGFNIMGSVSQSWNGVLYGRDRDFVNTNQPSRGLSADTRGTPIATAFAINPTAAGIGITQGGTLLGGTTGATALPGLVIPGTTILATTGINTLDLPGGAGCDSYENGFAYDEQLWNVPGARYACAYDTGRIATLQQPIKTLTYYGRGTVQFGAHQLFVEVTGSKADSAKRFSESQFTANNTTLPIAYPLNSITAATYNDTYDRIAAVFPAIGAVGDRTVDAVGNYGKPITFRYRCIECGVREYKTSTDTFRIAGGAEGPIGAGFDYRIGGSFARSESTSVLGTGFQYLGVYNTAIATNSGSTAGIPGAVIGGADPRAPTAPGATAPGIVGLFNSGILNPFSLTQSPAAIAGLKAISAQGVKLYGGRYDVLQLDGSVSGRLFALPGGDVQVAVGVDYRRETYSFNGSAAAATGAPAIVAAAFDNVNALTPKRRTVKAAYGEISIPIFEPLTITGAVRIDDYSGFGTTTNPKATVKFKPVDWLLFRGSYNTGFRVPSFNQIFNGVTESPNPGNTRVDPTTCPAGGTPNVTPGCQLIFPTSFTGGNVNLGPETSDQFSGGVVFSPMARFSAAVDFWSIAVDNTIGTLTLDQLYQNYQAFPELFIRNGGAIVTYDLRTANLGSRRTQGLEVSLRGGFDLAGGGLSFGLDGTRLLKKREKLLPSQPYSGSLIGVFTFAGDIGLKWKHNAFVSWANDNVTLSLTQIYRDGYRNCTQPQCPVTQTSRPNYNKFVDSYTRYNISAGLKVRPGFQITLGITNLLNTDPPFAITYDSNTGAGSSWEARIADPRGRAFTVATEVHF